MKQDITKAFDRLDERELGSLLAGLSADRLPADTCESIGKKACMRAGITEAEGTKRFLHISRRAIVAAAACIALIASLAVGGIAIAEETREYNAALAFCGANNISVAGMTRSEIKQVYRSFKNGTLTYSSEQPGEPVYTENTDEIGGTVFPAETGEPEYPVEFHPDNTKNGVCLWEQDEEHRNCISYFVGDELIWTCVTDGDMVVLWPEIIEGGVAVVGFVPGTTTPMVMKIDDNGEPLWSRTLGEGEITGVTGEPDGSVTVFSYVEDFENGTDNSVIVSRIDPTGELVFSTETHTPDPVRICEAVHYGEGYLAIGHIDDFDGKWNEQHVMRIDGEGRLLGEFDYSTDGMKYHLFDLTVYGDKLYISAYTRDDSVFGKLYGKENWADASVSDDEFTRMVKRAYKAVLLVCDPEECDIQVFYEAEGAYCLILSEDAEGFLTWRVNSVYSAEYTPGELSAYIKGKVKMNTYRFDLDGRFVDKIDSGEVTDF